MTPSQSDWDSRLVDLECRHVEQEAAIDALSEVVATQQQQIDQLEREMRALRRRLGEMAESDSGAASYDPDFNPFPDDSASGGHDW